MIEIISLGLKDLKKYMLDIGQKPFHADQTARWIYQRNTYKFEDMTDLKKSVREHLNKNAYIETLSSVLEEEEEGTARFVTELHDKNNVESVIIRNEKRVTLCISSQVGCKFGCRFCLTGKMGFVRNLTASEILWQVINAKSFLTQGEKITNIVFMGMGEPLQNLPGVLRAIEVLMSPFGFDFGKRKITISTVGYIPGMSELKESGIGVNLAISLNAANDKLRSKLMPINKTYPLARLKETLIKFPTSKHKRLVISYIMMQGVNDSVNHARELALWMHGLAAKVNLIPYNGYQNSKFKTSTTEKILTFQNFMLNKGFVTTIRSSKGSNIGGACGQLVDRKKSCR